MVPFNALRKMGSQTNNNQRQAQRASMLQPNQQTEDLPNLNQADRPPTSQPNQAGQIGTPVSGQRNQVHQINELLNMQRQAQSLSNQQSQEHQLDNLLDARNEADALILNDIFMRAEQQQSNEPNRQEPVYPTQEMMEDFLMEELFGNFDFHQHGLRNFLMDELMISDGFSQEFNSPQNNYQQNFGQPVEVGGVIEAAMSNGQSGQRVDKVPDDPQSNKQNQSPLPPASAGPSSVTCHSVSNANLCYCSECREVKKHEAKGMCKSCYDELHPQSNQCANCQDQKVNFPKKPIVECTGCGELKSLYLRNMCQACYRRNKNQAQKQMQSGCKNNKAGVTKKCKNCCKTNQRKPINPNQIYFWECEQCKLWKQIYANNMCKMCYMQFIHENESTQSSSSSVKKYLRCKKCLKVTYKDICDECQPFVKKIPEKTANLPVSSQISRSSQPSSQISRPSQPSSQISSSVSRQMPILSVQPATPPPSIQSANLPVQAPNQINCPTQMPSQVPTQPTNTPTSTQAPSQMPQVPNLSIPNQSTNRYVGRPLSYAPNPINNLAMHPFYQQFQHLSPCTQCSPCHRCPNTFIMNYLANRAFFSNIFGRRI